MSDERMEQIREELKVLDKPNQGGLPDNELIWAARCRELLARLDEARKQLESTQVHHARMMDEARRNGVALQTQVAQMREVLELAVGQLEQFTGEYWPADAPMMVKLRATLSSSPAPQRWEAAMDLARLILEAEGRDNINGVRISKLMVSRARAALGTQRKTE